MLIFGKNRWSDNPPVSAQVDWSHPAAQGLVGCWLLNEGGGVFIRSIGSSPTTGTFSTPAWTPSTFGVVPNINSANYIDFGNVLNSLWNSTAKDYTLEAWVFPTSSGDTNKRGIITKSANGIAGPILSFRSGLVYFEAYDGTNNPFGSGATTLTVNAWSHIVYTRKTSTTSGTIYVNGRSDATITDNSGDMTSSTNFRIGGDAAVGSGAYFPGYIGMAKVYSRALTASEVTDLYARPYAFLQPRIKLKAFAAAVAAFTASQRRTYSGPGTRIGARNSR